MEGACSDNGKVSRRPHNLNSGTMHHRHPNQTKPNQTKNSGKIWRDEPFLFQVRMLLVTTVLANQRGSSPVDLQNDGSKRMTNRFGFPCLEMRGGPSLT